MPDLTKIRLYIVKTYGSGSDIIMMYISIDPTKECIMSFTLSNKELSVSTPSRLCLFGEHLDYLGLEVIACAIDLRFRAVITPREDSLIEIFIRDSRIDTLNMENHASVYEGMVIDLDRPVIYENDRDYLRSAVAVLQRNGVTLSGVTVIMDSDIPIGKGMSSSSTMIVVLIKALLESAGHEAADDPYKIAYWAYLAEVEEFGEPGGMMDQYTSALGGLLNLDFTDGTTTARKMPVKPSGSFILFDSKEKKNTTAVLGGAKEPALRAISKIGHGVREILSENLDIGSYGLDEQAERVISAACENYAILLKAKELLTSEDDFDDEIFGRLIYEHHIRLRDGLGISTDKIEHILDTAIASGALGGKINGSGGGGCCFVYVRKEDRTKVLEAVEKIGFPGRILDIDTGVRVEDND